MVLFACFGFCLFGLGSCVFVLEGFYEVAVVARLSLCSPGCLKLMMLQPQLNEYLDVSSNLLYHTLHL